MMSYQELMTDRTGVAVELLPEVEDRVRALLRFYRAATVVTQGNNPSDVQWQEFDISGRACVDLVGAPLSDLGGAFVRPEGVQ